MESRYLEMLKKLHQCGWTVQFFKEPQTLPAAITQRYPWLPEEYHQFTKGVKTLVSPDQKAWFLTAADFSHTSDSAFAWNEWEQLSLQAAERFPKLRPEIIKFWDAHVPILISVKSGYAYLALEKETLRVVGGEEPEFEETVSVASSFFDLLPLLLDADRHLPGLI